MSKIQVGSHRPVYMWAGPGTIRMNRLKFMDAPVDEFVHHEGHTQKGAQRMAEAGFNWAYLMYDWGFPPEVEAADWADFTRAVKLYQAAGMKTFGYIQTSNCAFQGTYTSRNWYALDKRGRKIFYYTGRYMTCWRNPGWQAHLREMVEGVINAGADGVFFDNPWHAGQPLSFAGTWTGGAGCYCPNCRQAFHRDAGLEIPRQLNPDDDESSRVYLRWRVTQVTQTLLDLAAHARTLKPDVLVSANDFDAIMRPSYVIYGIDLPGLAKAQDILMIENFCLPRWEPDHRVLINNAITLRAALALAEGTPVTTDPYDKGIGFDEVYSPERFVQGIEEAAACGVPMVVKGTEFFHDKRFTLLTAEQFSPQRKALGSIHAWLEQNQNLFSTGKTKANIGLLFPGEKLWFNWHRLSTRFFGAGQALITSGYPWKVVASPEHLEGIATLLTFGGLPDGWEQPADLHTVDLLSLPDWELPPPSLLAKHKWLRSPVAFVVEELFRAYFHSRLARRVLDGIGLAHFFLQSPLFKLPPKEAASQLIKAVDTQPWFRVQSPEPVLIEVWERDGKTQVHLVNYHTSPQDVTLILGQNSHWELISPDMAAKSLNGNPIQLELIHYCILIEK